MQIPWEGPLFFGGKNRVRARRRFPKGKEEKKREKKAPNGDGGVEICGRPNEERGTEVTTGTALSVQREKKERNDKPGFWKGNADILFSGKKGRTRWGDDICFLPEMGRERGRKGD